MLVESTVAPMASVARVAVGSAECSAAAGSDAEQMAARVELMVAEQTAVVEWERPQFEPGSPLPRSPQ